VSPGSVVYVLAFAMALLVSGALLGFAEQIAQVGLVGGTPTSWAICTVFFQVVSLLGYTYAYASVRMLGVRRQAAVHVGVLALPLAWWGLQAAFVPPMPFGFRAWATPPDASPLQVTLWVCAALFATVGVPLFALTTCVPLLQRWFAETGHPASGDPYFLYASCCLGSLAGLLAYPLLVEPFVRLAEQGRWWLCGSAVSAALTAGCVILLWRSPSFFPRPQPEEARAAKPADLPPVPGAEPFWPPAAAAVLRRLHWIALSAVPVGLASTLPTYISVEVSAIPLMWMVPLVLSQLTLILAFARQPLFARLPRRAREALQLAHALAIVACLLALVLSRPPGGGTQAGPLTTGVWLILVPLVLLAPQTLAVVLQPVAALLVVFGLLAGVWVLPQLSLNLLAVFVAMRCCHGELARDRPPPDGLTGYFLCMAAGGVLGGLFAAVLAPLLFPEAVEEYWLALVLACMLRPGSARNGLSDRLIARGLCVLWQSGAATARLTRHVAALVMDWLYPPLLGVLTVELWVHREQFRPLMTSLGVENAVTRDTILCGLPLLLCLPAVARRVRFGLSLGAILLAKSLAPGDPERAAVTLLRGIPDADANRVLLPLFLLPLVLGAVIVLAGLLSVLLTDATDTERQRSRERQRGRDSK
jgi:hypothetical protein